MPSRDKKCEPTSEQIIEFEPCQTSTTAEGGIVVAVTLARDKYKPSQVSPVKTR